METEIASAAAKGLNSLWDISIALTVLTLVILGLLLFIRALLSDAREERNRYLQTLEKNTEAFNSLKEIIRVAISVK